MTPAVRKLFDYTSRHVTPKDVSDFCPDQLHHRWKHFVELSFPGDAANNSIAALRDALLYSTDSVA
jgi:hypothetical protein